MSDIKTCVDCRHCSLLMGSMTHFLAMCQHSANNEGVSLVTGKRVLRLCKDVRASDDWCGREARWFDPVGRKREA